MNDFEIIKNILVEYGKLVRQEINEMPPFAAEPMDSRLKDIFDFVLQDAERYKQKRNVENIMFGQLGLGLFALKQGNFVHINPYSDMDSMVAETMDYLNGFVDKMAKTSNDIHALSNAASVGDFTLRVDSLDWQGDVKKLVDGINGLCGEINILLCDSYEKGMELANAADILKSSTDSLSAASTQQASALEQTSASLEELTGAVRSNTEKANEMAKAAIEARNFADAAKLMATDTVGIIDEINSAISEINFALKTVETIASQTNILSLNAAIEATRAGTAGRGFAVVATEVRKLAAKSSETARHIKELVETAEKKSNSSKEISSKMISGLDMLNSKIALTASSVESVSKASNEQMTGIVQINEAIAQLDNVTQENSNTAEETDNIADNVATLAADILANAKSKKFVLG